MCYRCRVHDSTSSFRSGFAIHWLPRAVNKSSFITNLSPLSLSHCARGLTLNEVANVSIRPTVPVRSSMHFTPSQFPFSPVPQRDRAHNVRSFLIISSDAGAINRIPQFIRILTTTSEGFWIIYATFCYTYTHLPSRTATGVLKGVAQAYHGFAFARRFSSLASSVLHHLFAPPKHLSPQALVSFVCVCVCLA